MVLFKEKQKQKELGAHTFLGQGILFKTYFSDAYRVRLHSTAGHLS